VGIHLTPPLAAPDPSTFHDLSAAASAAVESLRHGAEWEDGYSLEQATKPQTIGYALVDSPVGLLAWIVERLVSDVVEAPTAGSVFPVEGLRPSRRWAEKRFRRIVHWNGLARGGHFAAWEQPELIELVETPLPVVEPVETCRYA
jgi:epoxide hydrolase